MKGYLKSPQGLFLLAPKVTTVGREGCDLVIQSSSVDQQHALLEYLPEDECFVLQDLNSVHGTYINDCKVENVSIRLCAGDIIRFGKSSVKHELVIEQQQRVSYLPLTSHTAWAQPLTLMQDETHPSDYVYSRGLPHLKTVVSTTTQFAQPPGATTTLPHPPPPSLRMRPLSAGSRRQYLDRTPTMGSQKTQKGSGWISGNSRGLQRSSSSSDLIALQEKEQKQLHLEEDLRRLEEEMQNLSHYETECRQKDVTIDQLYKENTQLQQRLKVAETKRAPVYQDSDITHKLRILEREVAAKKDEVNELRNKINVMERRNDSGNLTYRADDFKEVLRLRDELVHANSERQSANEYIRNLEQQLLLNKRTDSRSSDREIEDLTNQLREKGNEAKEYKEKLTQMQKIEEELNEKTEKIAVLEKHLKDAESARDKETNSAATMKADFEEKVKVWDEKTLEMETLQKQLEMERETITQLKEENRLKQTEMEQISAKTDDLYLQLGTICPGTNDSFNDLQQVIEAMKKVVDERLLYQSEIQKLETKLTETEELLSSHETFKTDISEVLATLDMNGCFARELKLEMTAVRSKSYISNLHDEVKDLFVRLLEIQLKWEEDIEAAFRGHKDYDPKISSDAPGKWIKEMSKKLSALEQEITSLHLKSDETDELHKIDLEVALDALREDLTKTHEDRLEAVKLEYKEELTLKITTEESAKRDEAIAEERTRISHLEAEIEQLKSDFNEKLENLTVATNTTQKFEEEIEMYKQTEDNLRQRIAELSKLNADSTEKFEKEMDAKINHHQEEVNEYKEQIHQHALTICAMEERLNLAATRHKDFQTEISDLKSEITALQSKTSQEDQHQPTEPPFQAGPQPKHAVLQQSRHHSPSPPQVQNPTPQLKPRIVLHSAAPDVALIQQTLAQVQQENADYAKQLQEQQNCIFALRRDLAGAKARLTDVSGELSEAQKQEMEHYKAKIKQQESEVTSLQQQMAKLSNIIDRQTTEIKGLNVEASKQKVIIGKYKNRVKEREVKLNEAASELSRTKTELGQKTSVIDNETAISSELSLQGAQCRGERHEQVIARQQEALAELRAKMRALEQGDVPLLTQDEAVQQVAVLRKEVEELRAMQLPYRRIAQTFGETADGMDPNQMSAARETSEAFELSENLYLSLLRGIASSLEMDCVGGMRSLLNLPPEERLRLAEERQRTCEELTLTVRALRDRVHRKDELLQGYEKDLAKLRRAENLTEMTSGQVQNVMTDLRKKTEEVHCLRESLRRTKDRLEQERRLNSSIKQKKTFHLEHEPVAKNGWPKHHCIQPDGQAEMYAKRKLQNEKRRRQYEKELREKENEIANHRKLLVDQDNRIQELS